MNKVSIFEHPEFGRIRTLEIDGKIWFCASDVAAALEIPAGSPVLLVKRLHETNQREHDDVIHLDDNSAH